jgi:5'-3' exonuclease
MDPEILAQFQLAQDAIEILGITLWRMYKYEADDAIASAVNKFKNNVDKVIIGSPDKDLAQCVDGERVVMWSTRKKEYMNQEGVKEKFGIEPNQIPDFLALAGDASDGIPGIKGVGPKTASSLISKYGDIYSINKSSNKWVDEIRSGIKIKTSLDENFDDIKLFKDLATLRLDVPISSAIEELLPKEIDENKLDIFCKDLGFENFKY